ncbi:hypothetical protein CEP54_013406 [Fusarium duplospermum]|uniref:2EXR domain-containing protein n=1 Tax=Fusarium duplospermum TaxID=1325734 RepID=A0A428P319_9HYPO|nr:hypothetical protein CEP54_013406 [Fusarium duplospermum]
MTITMTTFHPFPRLPREIRDLIWEKAANFRTEKRDVHFFTVFNGRNEEESAALAEYKLKGPSSGSCLAAPRRKGGQGFSWTEGNKSMYFLDRGLWTACSDSRAAIMKASLVSSDETTNGPRTAKFISEGQEQEMVVSPENDLFILQPYNWKTFKKLSLQQTSIFPKHDNKPHLKHVALELPRNEIINLPRFQDVENYPDPPEPSEHPIIDRLQFLIGHGRFQQIKTVWLIDYGLKRENPRPAARQFLADGLRFVEVTEDHDEWSDSRGDDGADALDFVGWLEEIWDQHIDGDRKADCLVLYKGVAVKAYRNTIDESGHDWTTGDGMQDICAVIATDVGESGSKIQFADLTGDDEGGYIVQYEGGAKAYRNMGQIPNSMGPFRTKPQRSDTRRLSTKVMTTTYFEVYEEYIVGSSGSALDQFMFDSGNGYFDSEI